MSQANLVRDIQYDTVYHEHLSFFNINSMKYIIEKHELFINYIEKPSIHGVSYLFEIGKITRSRILSYKFPFAPLPITPLSINSCC